MRLRPYPRPTSHTPNATLVVHPKLDDIWGTAPCRRPARRMGKAKTCPGEMQSYKGISLSWGCVSEAVTQTSAGALKGKHQARGRCVSKRTKRPQGKLLSICRPPLSKPGMGGLEYLREVAIFANLRCQATTSVNNTEVTAASHPCCI